MSVTTYVKKLVGSGEMRQLRAPEFSNTVYGYFLVVDRASSFARNSCGKKTAGHFRPG
jgi:hypothetical protein